MYFGMRLISQVQEIMMRRGDLLIKFTKANGVINGKKNGYRGYKISS